MQPKYSEEDILLSQVAPETDSDFDDVMESMASEELSGAENFTHSEKTAKRAVKRQSRIGESLEIVEIESAQKNKITVRSKVHSTKILRGRTPDEDTIALCALYKGFEVKIPFPYVYYSKELGIADRGISNEARLKREEQLLRKFLGAEIDFVIVSFARNTDGTYTIFASRKSALQKKIHNYFDKKDGKQIKAGDYIDVDIVNVSPNAVMINAKGFDIIQRKGLVTARWVEDLGEMFHVGETAEAKVREIQTDEKGNAISIKVSLKDAEAKTFIKNAMRLTPDMTCYARYVSSNDKVTRDENGNEKMVRMVHVFLEGYDCPGLATRVMVKNLDYDLREGDFVLFKVHRIYENQGFCTGTVMGRL